MCCCAEMIGSGNTTNEMGDASVCEVHFAVCKTRMLGGGGECCLGKVKAVWKCYGLKAWIGGLGHPTTFLHGTHNAVWETRALGIGSEYC